MARKRFVGVDQIRYWLQYLRRDLRSLLLIMILFMSAVFLPPTIAVIPSRSVAQQSNAQQLVQQAQQLYETGQFSNAIALWNQAAIAFEANGDRSGQAMALSNLSLTYQQLGQWSQADQTIRASLASITNSKSPNSILAQALDVQGRLQFVQGQVESALSTWKQAEQHYKQLRDRSRPIRNRINQAQALQALGLYRQAQTLLQEITQTLETEPNTLLKAMALRSLGNVLRVIGNLDQSRQVLEQSLTIARQVGNAQAIAETLLSLGNAAHTQNDRATALKFYQQAATTSASPITRIQAQLNQVSELIESQQFNSAQSLIPQIQTQLAQLPTSRSTIYAKVNLAQNLSKLRIYQSGIAPLEIAQLLKSASQQANEIGDARSQSYATGSLGELYEQMQQWAEATALTQQALLLAQSSDASDITYLWQWQLGRLLKQQKDLSGAIATYDAAVKTLQSLRYDLVVTNPDVQFSFREKVEPVYREFIDVLLQPTNKDIQQQTLQKAREVLESLQLAEVNNFLREACLEARRNLDRVIDQQDQTAAAIYPIVLSDRIEVILKLPQQPLRHYSVATTQQTFEKTIDDLRRALRKPHTLQTVQTLSGQLYDWLIRPIASDLANSQTKTLIFVLDGKLQNIPMAVLYDGKRYLVEQYSLALTPGLQLIEPKALKQLSLKALAAGVSEPRPPEFAALPNVTRELQEIRSEVSGRVLLNQQFTTQNLQAQMSEQSFPVVHIATHGQFSSNADQTFILAWDKPIRVNELNALLRTQGEQSPNAIELLVLSACETAESDQRAALGIAGVAVRAGARSTLASLWNVNDASTALLMREFYQAISNQQMTKAEALRQAQLALLKQPKYQRPMFWAPYVLVGNWL